MRDENQSAWARRGFAAAALAGLLAVACTSAPEATPVGTSGVTETTAAPAAAVTTPREPSAAPAPNAPARQQATPTPQTPATGSQRMAGMPGMHAGQGAAGMGPAAGPHGQGGPGMGAGSSAAMAEQVAQHFIQEMIPHHDDAVVMADLALAQAEHPELRDLAATIKRVQTDEIARMRQWYRDWYGADVPASTMAGAMGGMAGHDPKAIDGARPFDKVFIEQMIPHHEQAVRMASMALRATTRPELRELLQAIVTSQSAEIAQMRAWYEAWYGTPPPASEHGGMGGAHGQGMDAAQGQGMGGAHASGAQQPGAMAGHGQHGGMGGAQGATAGASSPYAGSFDPKAAIRALSVEEVQQIARGEGAGLAKSAELNGAPGPRHVLDLTDRLALTPQQQARIRTVLAEMQAQATERGERYLRAQEGLEQDIRAGRLAAADLPARLQEVHRLRADLETAHVAAHLVTREALTVEQVRQYEVLRGYRAP